MFRVLLIAAAALLPPAIALAGGLELLKPKSEPRFLPVDQAFEIQPLEVRDGKLRVSWRIAPGYYLYRQRLAFALVAPTDLKLGAPELPAGEKHQDEYFGEVEIYRQDLLTAALPVSATPPATLELKVSYQGCAEAGLCYPPQERVLGLGP